MFPIDNIKMAILLYESTMGTDKRNSSLVAEKRTDPEQIQSLIDKPYYVDQIKYKIE
jgi:hypothetical protein